MSLDIIRDAAAHRPRASGRERSSEPIDLRQRRRAFTADEIERVAIELFAARGFAEVTVDEIAEAAGISPRTFFRYFPTKAHVVRAHQRRLVDRLVRALAARPADEGPVTALREAFLATRRCGPRIGSGSCSSDGCWRAPATSATSGSRPDRTDELVAIVAEHAGLDPVTDLRPAVVVAAMTGAAQAAFRAWVESGGTVELATMVADALDLLNGGLADARPCQA